MTGQNRCTRKSTLNSERPRRDNESFNVGTKRVSLWKGSGRCKFVRVAKGQRLQEEGLEAPVTKLNGDGHTLSQMDWTNVKITHFHQHDAEL